MSHQCPTCRIPQGGTVDCRSCVRRGDLKWCLRCGAATTSASKWLCPKAGCRQPTSPEHTQLATEGYLSGTVDRTTRPHFDDALNVVRRWTSHHTLPSGHPKHTIILHHDPNHVPGTPATRYVLKPPPGQDWGTLIQAITPTTWSNAFISILGPCCVTSVALPLVLPGANRQDLQVDSRLPKFRTYNLGGPPPTEPGDTPGPAHPQPTMDARPPRHLYPEDPPLVPLGGPGG